MTSYVPLMLAQLLHTSKMLPMSCLSTVFFSSLQTTITNTFQISQPSASDHTVNAEFCGCMCVGRGNSEEEHSASEWNPPSPWGCWCTAEGARNFMHFSPCQVWASSAGPASSREAGEGLSLPSPTECQITGLFFPHPPPPDLGLIKGPFKPLPFTN